MGSNLFLLRHNLVAKCILNPSVQVIPNLLVRKSTHVDAIDSFTNELVSRKAIKWELFRKNFKLKDTSDEDKYSSLFSKGFSLTASLKDLKDLQTNPICIRVDNLDATQLDNLLMSALEERDISNLKYIIDECIKYKVLSSSLVTLNIMDYLASTGDKKLLISYIELFSDKDNRSYTKNVDCAHFIAKCLWHQGNSTEAINLLYKSFEAASKPVRGIIKTIFCEFVEDSVGKRSEAVLVLITKIALDINNKLSEPFVLATLWKSCFTSEWFSDQQLANQLFDDHKVLRDIVAKKSTIFSYMLLTEHDVIGVHRLIELLLKHEMKTECRLTLGVLFDYQYWKRDLRACSEIIQNCLDLDLPLHDLYNQKLLNLLLGDTHSIPVKEKSLELPKYEYKF